MKIGIVVPSRAEARVADVTMEEAYALAGLRRGETDHGGVAPGIAIVVYEFGLMEEPSCHSFFAIGRQLFAGGAVLYAFDEGGESVDLSVMPPVFFFGSVDAIELAIASGQIDRPQTKLNDRVLWEWNRRRKA